MHSSMCQKLWKMLSVKYRENGYLKMEKYGAKNLSVVEVKHA